MATTRPPHTSDRARRLLLAGFVVLAAVVLVTRILAAGATAQAAFAAALDAGAGVVGDRVRLVDAADPRGAGPGQVRADTGKAVVLGIVEGVTEFLPISSTGHLLVAERIMDIGQTPATKSAADTYTIAIQIGAILAVVVLYSAPPAPHGRGRHRQATPAAAGRSSAIVIAFVPAAIVGVSSGASSSRTTCSRCGRSSSRGSSAAS